MKEKQITNQEKMQKEREILTKNLSFNLLSRRTGNLDKVHNPIKTIDGVTEMAKQLNYHGGYFQQSREIKDKQKSLAKALLYSYQGAFVKKYYPESDKLHESKIVRALINPNKLKQDYDDKIISIGFEHEFKTGDIFEWVDTNTYWLIYLQQATEVAYFRGDIRRCRYQISWKDGNETKSTFAAVRGPVETKINYIQKHGVSIDTPNYSLSILMPLNEDTLKQFKRYSKFYLQNIEGSKQICWRVEAVDAISTPGILEVAAVEYYANEFEDDMKNGIVGGLIEEIQNPNTEDVEETIIGETFIKPKTTYTYYFNGSLLSEWVVKGKHLPLKAKKIDDYTIEIIWDSTYSGQFTLSYGDYEKTIVVESLF